MGWLLKLPCEVTVRCAGEGPDGSVLDEFLRDRKKVASVDELKEFVKEWLALWDMDDPKDALKLEDINEAVYKHFKRLQRHNARYNPDDPAQAITTRILLPKRLFEASMTAKKYHAPFNVALIQRYADDEDRKVVF